MKTSQNTEDPRDSNLCQVVWHMHAGNVPWVMNRVVSVSRVKCGIRPAEVIQAVAECGGVSAGSMLTSWRASHVARLRQLSMLIIRSEACPHMSLPDIARIFDRDHTTIIHGIRAARKAIAENPDWARVYEEARAKLGLGG